MNASARKPANHAVFSEHHVLDRGVVGEHRHEHIRNRRRFSCRFRDASALFGERLRLLRRAVVDHELMTRGDESTRHRATHTAESDDSNFHVDLLVESDSSKPHAHRGRRREPWAKVADARPFSSSEHLFDHVNRPVGATLDELSSTSTGGST